MGDILLLEPTSSGKRRTFSDLFIKQGRAQSPGLQELKKRLREIRNDSVDGQEVLVRELMSRLDMDPGTEIFFADNAHQAVNRIKEIAGDSPLVLNRSAVVTRELMPLLTTEGCSVRESYYDEFKPFDNRFQAPRQLPDMLFEPLWDSFDRPVDLNEERKWSIQRKGVKEFTGLIGVNAISAKDGSVALLQHMHNINKIFEQGKKIILVAGLDKIVHDRSEAIFLAKCMAVFGVEALPLTFSRGARPESGIQDLPFHPVSRPADPIHLILLDNGRRRILQSEYRDLLACIGCRACVKACPASPYLTDGDYLSPREYLYLSISGQNPLIDRCLQCRSCEAECPLNMDLPGMMRKVKNRMAKSHQPLSDRLLSNVDLFEEWGSHIPWLASMILKNRLLRRLGEKWAGISMERRIPDMQGGAFVKRFRLMKSEMEDDRNDHP